MPGSAFAAAVLAATLAHDAYMAEDFLVQPMMAAPDVNAPAAIDPSRPLIEGLRAVYLDPEARPSMPNSYDPRQVRRPGLESGHPQILLSPSAIAALPSGFAILRGDQLTQVSSGRVFRVATVFPMAGGSLKLNVNVVG